MRMQEGRLRESEVEKRRGGRAGESLWDCRSACSAHMIILPRAARDLSAFREGWAKESARPFCFTAVVTTSCVFAHTHAAYFCTRNKTLIV